MPQAKKRAIELTFPLSIFETADTIDDLEDWLISRNPEFIKRMRKARIEDIKEIGKNWKALFLRYAIAHFKREAKFS